MNARLVAALLLLSCGGCVNLYTHVDTLRDSDPSAPDEQERFAGLRDYMGARQEFHVLQMHGMGDHTAEADCGPHSPNLQLQDRIAARMGFTLEQGSTTPLQKIRIGDTLGGTYATRRFRKADKTLYFTCLTWGEASRVVKQRMLGLKDDFTEDNENQKHRAPVNSFAKRFVNESFADPVIYLGTFGAFQRATLWKGLQAAGTAHGSARTPRLQGNTAQAMDAAAIRFYRDVDMAVISDSLGSRVIFDTLCERQGCNDPARASRSLTAVERQEADGAEAVSLSIRSLYMLANQLPLLELAFIEAPSDTRSLDQILGKDGEQVACFRPPLPSALAPAGRTQLIAFTDANDALSYHLGQVFKQRCAGNLHIVNVTLPNALPRWLFVYAHLPKAHSGGFKTNDRAIRYLVEGNGPAE